MYRGKSLQTIKVEANDPRVNTLVTQMADVFSRLSLLEEGTEQPPTNPPAGDKKYTLAMDGATSYIQVPNLTFTKIVFDYFLDTSNPTDFTIFDGRLAVALCYISPANSGIFNVSQDGVAITGPYAFTKNKRLILESNSKNGAVTAALSIFRRQIDPIGQYVKGKIYDIKIYNGATLQAHYDCSKGNLQDQSGNNNHATLHNGAWEVL